MGTVADRGRARGDSGAWAAMQVRRAEDLHAHVVAHRAADTAGVEHAAVRKEQRRSEWYWRTVVIGAISVQVSASASNSSAVSVGEFGPHL